jgi:hypothetical protein
LLIIKSLSFDAEWLVFNENKVHDGIDMTIRISVKGLMLGCCFGITGVSYTGMSYAGNEIGKVTHLSGILAVERAGEPSKVLSIDSVIMEGDLLKTEEDAFARIKFTDKSEIVLRPETEFKVNALKFNPDKPEDNKADMDLIKGGMRAVTGLIGKNNPDAVRTGTPTATIGIRGTHYGAMFCDGNCGSVPTASGSPPPNGLHTDVVSGGISLTNSAGTVNVGAGQYGYVANGGALPAVVPPSQGVPVVMPPSISQNDANGRGMGKSGDTSCGIR